MASIFFLSGDSLSLRITASSKAIDIFSGHLYTEEGGFNWNAKKVGSIVLSEQDIEDLMSRLALMRDG
jgi:hypothetical protein